MSKPRIFIREPRVLEMTGKSRSQLHADIKAGKFPPSIPISAKSKVWDEAEIVGWQEACVARRDLTHAGSPSKRRRVRGERA